MRKQFQRIVSSARDSPSLENIRCSTRTVYLTIYGLSYITAYFRANGTCFASAKRHQIGVRFGIVFSVKHSEERASRTVRSGRMNRGGRGRQTLYEYIYILSILFLTLVKCVIDYVRDWTNTIVFEHGVQKRPGWIFVCWQ